MRFLSISLFLLLVLVEPVRATTVMRHAETASGALGWRIQSEHIMIELNPLYKDQIRAFYLGRGFSEPVTERISQACVFQTVIRNVSGKEEDVLLEVNLADWRLTGRGQTAKQALTSKDAWLQELATAGASTASRLAFRWATFPEQQDFKLSGDYGWGMILFGKQPEDSFDLLVKWRENAVTHEQIIENLNCLGESPTS